MSGLYLLTLLAIWLFIDWVIYRTWKSFKPGEQKWRIFFIFLWEDFFFVIDPTLNKEDVCTF